MESSRIDLASFTWRAIKYKAEQSLKDDRELIEQRGLEQRDTDFARGRISAMREILDLAERDSEHVSD